MTETGPIPWRVLILDPAPDDPKWIIATITISADVRQADIDPQGRFRDWNEVCQWVQESTGHSIQLLPIPRVLAWDIRE